MTILNETMSSAMQHMAQFEQRYQLLLPRDYKEAIVRDALRRYRHWMFKFVGIDNCDNATNIDAFFGFDAGTDSVPSNYEFYVSAGRLPAQVVPIGRCVAGNLICLDLRTDRRGTICYWDHEFEPVLAAADNLAVLAPDLASFLTLLQQDD